jgi:hypothetical protein
MVCHYAAKTVENILAQGGGQGRRFSTLEVAARLVELTLHRRSDALHATAASALAHLLRRALLTDAHLGPTPPAAVAHAAGERGGTVAGPPGASGAAGPRLVARLFERSEGLAEALACGVGEATAARLQECWLTMLVSVFWEDGDGAEAAALEAGGRWRRGGAGGGAGGAGGGDWTLDGTNSPMRRGAASALASRPLRNLRTQVCAALL